MNQVKRFSFMCLLALAGLLAVLGPARPASAQAGEPPVVRAVMFWMDTCGHCHYVLENVLPPLQEQYGEQLDILLVEIVSREDADRLTAVAAELGLPAGGIGVPFMLVGDHVLIGADQIPAELPGLIETYLAEGGVEFPALAALEDVLPKAELPPAPFTPVEEGNGGVTSLDGGFVAVVVILFMTLALALAAATPWLARSRVFRPTSTRRLWAAVPVLSLVGLAVAGYLTYVETQAVAAVCGPVGDCNAVQSSSYARLFGVPIGLIGVAGYLAILAVWAWGRRTQSKMPATLLVLMTGAGVAFSIYLTYLELLVIRAVCMWCITSAVIMTLLLLVSVGLAVGTTARRSTRMAH